VVEEVGELAEAIRREEPENIEEELADCFAWIGALANLYGVDLKEAQRSVPEKVPWGMSYMQAKALHVHRMKHLH
jgi:NTP pyrophosphatase (non-canonical NTP hydrolase)